jgi:hypothetical protein
MIEFGPRHYEDSGYTDKNENYKVGEKLYTKVIYENVNGLTDFT